MSVPRPKKEECPRSAMEFLPLRKTLESLRQAAARCRGCELHCRGTQTVFGEGSTKASLVLVGEQPGDVEDRLGKPFVGPAGKLLRRAMQDAGIDEKTVYLTNAVKHFRWVQSGKRRLHQSPLVRHIEACRPWLLAELDALQPEVVICLGATATYSALKRRATIRSLRGRPLSSELCSKTVVTVHPSSLLRIPDPTARQKAYLEFVRDLRVGREALSRRRLKAG